MKKCGKCGMDKELCNFYVAQSTKDGYSWSCKDCVKLSSASWQKENRERYNASVRERRKHPDRFKKAQRSMTKFRYGISREEYNAIFEDQDRKCAICGTETPGDYRNAWNLDHNHETKQVRGILCFHCNMAIGYLKDNPLTADLAAAYLRGFSAEF